MTKRHPLRLSYRKPPSTSSTARTLKCNDDCFRLGVEFQHFVAHLAAPTGLLVTTKRERGIENVVAIDPHRSCFKSGRDTVSLGDVACPDPRCQAVRRLVSAGNQFLGLRERFGDHHRTKDLF